MLMFDLLQDRAHFDMIHLGAYITGASALPLVISTSIPAAVVFVVILSLGAYREFV